ncbi:ABC transporter ATP-binding protein [Aliidiomarina indica]|uniref:ABC transporter ATP-binding protein n=1 Tax=Aliidiomarina indica TaxID=2749147 RepID=UPI00188E43FF|nr:ABC transporter ATP-binding protein [Aliidiomarina indica]
MSLQLHDVHFSYERAPLFTGLSTTLPHGQLIGILGENGSGKSTLLKLVAGIEPVQRGQICWQGQSVQGWSPEQRARTLGYLGQNVVPAWSMWVEDVVKLARVKHSAHAVTEAMARTDCLHLAQRKVTELSAGELQRVLLARVLVGAPPLLLADEPTAGLDPRHQVQVMQVLHDHAQAGATVVVVMHDLIAAQQWCDHVLVLSAQEYGSGILAEGRAQEVLSPAFIRDAFGVDVPSR